MWNAEIASQLKGVFERLKAPVVIEFHQGKLLPTETLRDGEALRDGLSLIHPLITVGTMEQEDASWKIAIRQSHEAEARWVFHGLPGGHEFTSLILAILNAGGHPPKVDDALTLSIPKAALPSLLIETFYSQTCHNCPEVVQACNALAALNGAIRHVAIDGQVVPEEVAGRGIMATPSVWVNGKPFHHGRASLEELWEKLHAQWGQPSEAETLVQPSVNETQVLIVGGGPAGLSAAVYTARKGLKVDVVAERWGGQVADTVGIENWVGVHYTEGAALTRDLVAHAKQYSVGMHLGSVESMEFLGDSWIVKLKNGNTWRAEQVIAATGARWRNLNVPGEDVYKNRGVAYCPHCDGPLFKGKRVAVVGGGNSGVEAAIDLAGIVDHVTLVEFAPTLKADIVLQERLRSLNNVTVITNAQTLEVVGDGAKVTALRYRDRNNQQDQNIELAGVFVQIGLVPNTQFIPESVKNRFGEVEIETRGKTGLPRLYAAGDAASTPHKQIVIAIGSGATAALTAFEDRMHFGAIAHSSEPLSVAA